MGSTEKVAGCGGRMKDPARYVYVYLVVVVDQISLAEAHEQEEGSPHGTKSEQHGQRTIWA